MTGLEYFEQVFSRKYMDFNGRARRKEYWYTLLFHYLILLILISLTQAADFFSILYLIYCLASFLPILGVTVRRLHDTGKSGWFTLLSFIPFIGPIMLIIYFCNDSEPNTNEYGLNPKGNYNFEFETINTTK